ncbi:MAG: CDP-diacylglycerol--glycerol-3-phosphate 3-phosphatidyltransferase [Planctomycetaceae bacterium]|nr:CDP-diacylglycerol--glycerol-3-phosphate 3-phosphatidyltransferase [Planctomycetaceae bacterium]
MEANKQEANPFALNLPNQITITRLVVSILVFVCIPMGYFIAALIFFLIAAGTDWADGYIARKYQLVTKLGRILDPFADKILICGAFIFLGAEPGSEITAWMAVVVVGRELLVTVLRSFMEEQGVDFSAQMAGKLKMVFQCVAVVASLALLATSADKRPDWLLYLTIISVWTAIVSTIYSGAGYIIIAARLLRQPKP